MQVNETIYSNWNEYRFDVDAVIADQNDCDDDENVDDYCGTLCDCLNGSDAAKNDCDDVNWR